MAIFQHNNKFMYTFVYTHQKKLQEPHNPPTPSRGGFVFVFPFVFHPFFPKVGKQSQTYEPVSILDIDYLCSILARAHYARKTPSKYDIFDTLIRHKE